MSESGRLPTHDWYRRSRPVSALGDRPQSGNSPLWEGREATEGSLRSGAFHHEARPTQLCMSVATVIGFNIDTFCLDWPEYDLGHILRGRRSVLCTTERKGKVDHEGWTPEYRSDHGKTNR